MRDAEEDVGIPDTARRRRWLQEPAENGASRNGASIDIEPLRFRTLADIEDSPPGDLLFGMLEPADATMLYSPGGVGKGTTCAWLIAEAVKHRLRPMIFDAEGHPREWRRRVSGLGVDPARVVYLEPHELPDRYLGKPLNEVVPHLGELKDQQDRNILFIDSVLAASNLSEEGLKSNPRMPYQYVAALSKLDIPTVSIGHTSKHSPDGDPYGSVSWMNAMRLVWHGARATGDGVHFVRWQPRKKNERGAIPGVLLEFQYDPSGRLCGVVRSDDEASTRSWVRNALVNGPRTVDDLAEEMAEGSDDKHAVALERAKELVRKTLNRMRKDGLAHKAGGRGSPWALGASVSRKPVP